MATKKLKGSSAAVKDPEEELNSQAAGHAGKKLGEEQPKVDTPAPEEAQGGKADAEKDAPAAEKASRDLSKVEHAYDVTPDDVAAAKQNGYKGRSFDEILKELQQTYLNGRHAEWSTSKGDKPENVQHTEKDHDQIFNDYMRDFHERLAALHMAGGYDRDMDTLQMQSEAFLDSRKEMVAKSPEDKEIDRLSANEARHQQNMEDALMKSGNSFTTCRYFDKDGNELHMEWPDPPTMQAATDKASALCYGIDHGLITVKGKDGQEIPGFPVKDEYTQNLDFYDTKRAEIADYRMRVQESAVGKLQTQYENVADPQGHPTIAGCEITATTNQQFRKDGLDLATNDMKYLQEQNKQWQNGGNAYLQTLQQAGLQAVPPELQNPAPQAGKDKDKQAIINEALGHAGDVKGADGPDKSVDGPDGPDA